MIDLSDKIALVTGASRGIGQSISMILAQNGAHVVCVSRNVNDVQSVADKITHQKFNISDYFDILYLYALKKIGNSILMKFLKLIC